MAGDETDVRWLSAPQERAWRSYRAMAALLELQLSRDLVADSQLSAADYEVLSTLSEHPDHTWPLGRLAAKMLWSSSRLSHHTTRMAGRGLVTRLPDPDDRRGCLLRLTDEGFAVLRAAAPHHVASVRRHLVDRLTPEQVRVLGEIADTVLSGLPDVHGPGARH